MYSDPSAFYAFNPVGSSVVYILAPTFSFNGDLNVYSSSPSVPPAPKIIKVLTWYINSGVTNHIKNDSSKLLKPKVYVGAKKLLVGNGYVLHIKHIGSILLATTTQEPWFLNYILHVPHITKNLLSVSNSYLTAM